MTLCRDGMRKQHCGRKTQWFGGSTALGSASGGASSCFVDSYLVGNGVLGMGLKCEQCAEGPSGPPGDAVAVASVLGSCASPAEFRGSTSI